MWKGPVWNGSPCAPVLGLGGGSHLLPRSCLSELGVQGFCSSLSCSCPLKSAPALGSAFLNLTFMLPLSVCPPFLTPRLPKLGAWRKQRPDKVTSPVPLSCYGPMFCCFMDVHTVVCSSLHRDRLPSGHFQVRRGEWQGPWGRIGGYTCPSPPTSTPSEHSCSGACHGQGDGWGAPRTARGGLGEGWG